jgi:hypothetical protein
MKLPFIWRNSGPATTPNTWTWFRTVFDWQPKLGTKIHFSADPTARLLVNGEVVIARVMRYVTPQITVEELDLGPFLRPGRNIAVVLHHWWGVPTFQRSAGVDAGFAIESRFLRTDGSWRWRDGEEFLHHQHQIIGQNTQRVRFPQVIDTRLEQQGIHDLAYDNNGWSKVAAKRSAAWSAPVLKETAPLERVQFWPEKIFAQGHVERPSPVVAPQPEVPMSWLAMHSTFIPSPSALTASAHWPAKCDGVAELRGGRDGYVTLDFGRPLHGYLKIEIEEGPPGAELDFLYGEMRVNPSTGEAALRPDGSINCEFIVGAPFGERVILRGGRQTIEIPEERTLRWLLVIWKSPAKPIKLRAVSVMTSQHPAPLKGSFQGGPKEIPTLIRLCIDHARVTMSDTYVDTTGREDGQWLEDIQYRAALAAHWFGDVKLRQVTLRHAVEQQAPNGRFRAFAPDDHAASYAPQGLQSLDWGMVWTGILYDDWRWTGETTRLRKYFPNLVRFFEAAHRQTNAEGLLVDRTIISDIKTARRANFDFGEIESIANAWYHGFLLHAIDIAKAIGRRKEAVLWQKRAGALRAGFGRFIEKHKGGARVCDVWSPEQGPLSAGQGSTLSAVFYDIVPENKKKELLLSAFDRRDGSPPKGVVRWNNPTYMYRALRVLSDHGLGEIAARHFLERYRPYLPDGPLPEYFLPLKQQPSDATGSHGWAAVPMLWLHDTVLGVRLQNPGGSVIAWQPKYVGWAKVAGKTVTPHGYVEVDIDWKQRRFDLRAPKGVKVVPSLPR